MAKARQDKDEVAIKGNRTMHEIKSFKIFQTARVVAVMYAVFFGTGAVFELILFFVHDAPRKPPLSSVPFMLIVPTIFGFISATILCWIYNLVAARIGGIAFELTPRSEN